MLILCQNVTAGLVVYPQVIAANLDAELPFMATENILMAAVAAGGDRQDLHERIRRHCPGGRRGGQGARRAGTICMARLAADPAFAGVDLAATLEPAKFVGRAPQQVDEFLAEVVDPLLAQLSRGRKRGRGSQGVVANEFSFVWRRCCVSPWASDCYCSVAAVNMAAKPFRVILAKAQVMAPSKAIQDTTWSGVTSLDMATFDANPSKARTTKVTTDALVHPCGSRIAVALRMYDRE